MKYPTEEYRVREQRAKKAVRHLAHHLDWPISDELTLLPPALKACGSAAKFAEWRRMAVRPTAPSTPAHRHSRFPEQQRIDASSVSTGHAWGLNHNVVKHRRDEKSACFTYESIQRFSH